MTLTNTEIEQIDSKIWECFNIQELNTKSSLYCYFMDNINLNDLNIDLNTEIGKKKYKKIGSYAKKYINENCNF